MSRFDRYTCEQVFQLLDDFADRELSADDMRKVNAHLDICAGCASEYQFHGEVLAALRARIQRISVSEGLRDRVAVALGRVRTEISSA